METVVNAAAKINVYLKVTARRADSYHEIESIFLPFPALADVITADLQAPSGIAVRCSDPALPQDLENLAGKAAGAYAAAAGIIPSWSFYIEKHIPSAAGMGGGSSDAGAVLSLLQKRYHALTGDALLKLAAGIGADVPYFLNPFPALVRGIGERIEPLGFPVKCPPLLAVNPRFPISAKWAYTHLDKSQIGPDHSGKRENLLNALRTGNTELFAENLHNDLEFAAYEKFPLLRMLKKNMLESGAPAVLMTGSGSTLFAVCQMPEACRILAEKLENRYPGCLTIKELVS